ncbi:MAG: hypothetical protein KDB32_13030, partial [Planctomycetes bacterium]|nr:hypothetical protein [Planctomycetota bacterium]
EQQLDEFNKNPQNSENQQAQKAAQEAQRAMKKAREDLNKQDSSGAEEEQKKAEEKLQEAEQALEEELNQYVQSQQEQMLVQVEENLKLMKQKQLEVNDDTVDLDLKVRQRGDWNRALKTQGKKLYRDQEEVKKAADETLEALKTGNYGGFTRNMELINKLLIQILGQVEGNEVGEGTQLDQGEVIEKLDRMLNAVEGERKRLAKKREQGDQGDQPPPGQGQPAPEPLVSKLAEMELIYEEQKALGEKIRNLGDSAEEYNRDNMPDYYRRLYERYSAEQSELKKAWDELRKGIPGYTED